MEQKTRWFQPWTNLCPVCGSECLKESEDVLFTSHWKCKTCPSIGRIRRDPTGKLQPCVLLDNPEVVYKDYPDEKTFTFMKAATGNQQNEYTVRESHLTQEEEKLLVGDVIAYYESMPDNVQRHIKNKLWRDK